MLGDFAMRFIPVMVLILVLEAAHAPGAAPLDRLDPRTIPEARRLPDQPKELVAILGEPRKSTKDRHIMFTVVFRPDGQMIACTCADQTAQLFDLSGGEC